MSIRLNMARMMACHAVVTITAGLSMVVITRHYGAHQYGAFSVAWGIVGMLSLLTNMGMQFILVRDLAVSFEEGSKMLAAAFTVLFTNTLVAALILLGLSFFIHFDVPLSYVFLATSGLLSAQTALWSVYRAKEQFRQEATLESAKTVLYLMVVLALTLFLGSRHILDAALSQFVLNVVFIVLVMYMVRRAYGHHFAPSTLWRSINKHRIATVYKTGFSMMCITAGALMYSKITVVMIGHMLGDHAAGVFGAGYRLFETAVAAVSPLLGVLYPQLVKLADDGEQLRQRMKRILVYLVAGWIGSGLVIYLLSPFLVITLLGKEYTGTVMVLQLLGWGVGISAIASLYGLLFRVLRLEAWLALITASGGVVNVALNLVMIPRYGTRGACIAMLLSLAFVVLACVMVLLRRPSASQAQRDSVDDEELARVESSVSDTLRLSESGG